MLIYSLNYHPADVRQRHTKRMGVRIDNGETAEIWQETGIYHFRLKCSAK
jgi:hypothetical protein